MKQTAFPHPDRIITVCTVEEPGLGLDLANGLGVEDRANYHADEGRALDEVSNVRASPTRRWASWFAAMDR